MEGHGKRLDGHIEAFNKEVTDSQDRRRELYERVEGVETSLEAKIEKTGKAVHDRIDTAACWLVRIAWGVGTGLILMLLSATVFLLKKSLGW